MVVRMYVLLQLVKAALLQHVCESVALKSSNATSRVAAILGSLRWLRGHVEIAQENAVCVIGIRSVFPDSAP